MSRSTPRRLAALFLTASLASLAVATPSAQAADLVGQSSFDLSATSFGVLNLGGDSASKSYSTSWDQTSKNLGTGVKCKLGVCAGSDLTLRTTGALGATFSAAADAGTATLSFKQLTSTTLKDTGLGGQYHFSTSAVTPVGPTFTTTGASASVNVTGALSQTDSLHAEGCVVSCGTSNQNLLSFSSGSFPIVGMTTAGGGSVSVGGQQTPGVAGQSIPVKYGSVKFGSVGGLTSSGGAASRSDPVLTESLNLLNMATSGGASALQGSVKLKLGGLDLGTVAYNAGSASLNAIESLVQSATMTVASVVHTLFRDKSGADISLLVKPSVLKDCHGSCPTPTPSGYYSVHDTDDLHKVAKNVESNGFLIGDGSVDLGGDQIVTATTYNVSFQELLGVNLSGTIDLAALQGKAFGDGFGPVFSTEINLGGQSWTVYSHTFTRSFTAYDTVLIPDTVITPPPPPPPPILPGVPEPATWALMLVGFGAVGLTLRRRPNAPLAA